MLMLAPIGHIVRHGKTTLTAAVFRSVVHEVSVCHAAKNYKDMATERDATKTVTIAGRARRVRVRCAPLCAHRLPGPRGLHQEHDYRRGADGRRYWWCRRRTARCPRPASTSCSPRRSGVPKIVVFLNKIDLVDDAESTSSRWKCANC